MRYAWDLREEYLARESPVLRPFIRLFLDYLREWDRKGSKGVDYFIANSRNVQQRIWRCYHRKSTVIYPPVDTSYFTLKGKKEDYYLVVSRLIEYKKNDMVIEAFNRLGKRLVIVGTGRDMDRLKKMAKPNITLTGFISDKKMREYYRHAKGFIFPQLEDFGITSVESQACGTPVIAFAKGGALETVIEGKTGHFFHEQTPEALIKAITEFEKMTFDPKACRRNALRFDKRIFKRKIKAFVEEKYREWKRPQPKLI
ncbi:MAG: glycosyltransferase [Nanoarchaeota archaeon]